MQSMLGYEVRKEGEPHNCLDDACAAMKLVLAKIEKGFDDNLPLVVEDAVCVPEEEMQKVFIHRVPMDMKSEDLHKVIPGDYTLDQKMIKNAKSRTYSIHAIFKNEQEALEAYDNISGQEGGDSRGRPQKAVPVELSSGVTETIYVRKTVGG
ncbi:Small RNA degrading nuclease 1-like protein, partial [Drosera capensis]